jgi:hypothetical protein
MSVHIHDDAAAPEHPHAAPFRDKLPAGLLALQRVAGNRAVTRLLTGTTATVQRCGPGGCGPGGCSDEEKAAPGQGVTGAEDEFATPAQARVQRTADGPGRAVQRVASWAAGPVHEVNNLADCVINGTPAGVTWPTLNGNQFWSSAAVRAALAKPVVTTAAVAAGGFDAQVTAVGNNTASFDETVLKAGPWRLRVPKATIAAQFPTLIRCTGAGTTRFRAFGDPSDAAMYQANRRHEDKHAADHRAAFTATVVAWDTKLTAALTARTTFHGATAPAAEAALWAAVGGTPDQVADAFLNQCVAAVVAYHGSPAGGPIGAPTSPSANRNCSASSAKYTNPS